MVGGDNMGAVKAAIPSNEVFIECKYSGVQTLRLSEQIGCLGAAALYWGYWK